MNRQFYQRARTQLRQLGHQQPKQKIFYMHVPKCGGTSVANAIRNSFMTWNPADDQRIAHLDPYAADQAAQVAQMDPLAYNRKLLPYFLGAGHYRYVYGHFAFDEATYAAFADQWAFVTLLRDPVKKWFSLYYYNRYKKADFFKIEEELEEFVNTPLAQGYGCDYVMQFAGHDHGVAVGEIANYTTYTTQPAIARAMENLQKFHLVGALEQLDRFVEQFALHYGTQLQIATKNHNPIAKQQQAVSDEVMAKVRELCQPNLILYQYAVDHLLGRAAQTM